jgi:hydrogenase maturation protein HypF
MAACMAENSLMESVIGVALDGTGLGTDGAIWGGEFLVGDYHSFRRFAHFRYLGMPGGEQAIREPWRMGLAYLEDAGAELPAFTARISPLAFRTIKRMLEKRFNCPMTSSVGRLFDAVAALAGVRDRVSHEGQAAMEMEFMAADVSPEGFYPFKIQEAAGSESPLIIDTRPLIAAVATDVRKRQPAAAIARRFHTTMAEIIVDVCHRVRQRTGNDTVVLSGGVFQNTLLTMESVAGLKHAGFRIHRHRLVPPNDGGLSLGQLAVAAAQIAN